MGEKDGLVVVDDVLSGVESVDGEGEDAERVVFRGWETGLSVLLTGEDSSIGSHDIMVLSEVEVVLPWVENNCT